jgi:exodeoxyribonuclease VII large subunit
VATQSARKALSVSAAVDQAKRLLGEHVFHITGEVSQISDKRGYRAVYFTIKDENAVLDCLMWKNRYEATGLTLTLGAKVEVMGKFSIYAPKGRMNFEVTHLTLAGEGDLRARVARLAEQLRREGHMEPEAKLPLPPYPETIGLVTSPRGAVVHDVLRTLRRYSPGVRVLFAGVPVEGKNAATDMMRAMDAVMRAGAEVVLLVRGGGSFEDFMPFNDEQLARFIIASRVPIVTGIGHEPDTTIADMVADLRASTPTHAAQLLWPKRSELDTLLLSLGRRMGGNLSNRLGRSAQVLDAFATRPVLKDPLSLFSTDLQRMDAAQASLERFARTALQRPTERVDELQRRLSLAIPASIDARAVQLARSTDDLKRIGTSLVGPYTQQAALVASRMNDLSPLRTLERGWSIAKGEDGSVVGSVEQVSPGDALTIQLKDGTVRATVDQTTATEPFAVIEWEEEQ